jgi:hypothetical protein
MLGGTDPLQTADNKYFIQLLVGPELVQNLFTALKVVLNTTNIINVYICEQK